MSRFKNYVWMAAGFAVLVAVVSGITAGPMIAALVKAALVKNVDERGRAPYIAHLVCDSAGNTCTVTGVNPVPGGKRLVIEHVNGTYALNGQGQILILTLYRYNSANVQSGDLAQIPASFRATIGGFNTFITNDFVQAYLEAGESPGLFIKSSVANDIEVNLDVTGYLVDLTI